MKRPSCLKWLLRMTTLCLQPSCYTASDSKQYPHQVPGRCSSGLAREDGCWHSPFDNYILHHDISRRTHSCIWGYFIGHITPNIFPKKLPTLQPHLWVLYDVCRSGARDRKKSLWQQKMNWKLVIWQHSSTKWPSRRIVRNPQVVSRTW